MTSDDLPHQVRRALELEVLARREIEETTASVREALGAANEVSRVAEMHVEASKRALESTQKRVMEEHAAVVEATVRERLLRESLEVTEIVLEESHGRRASLEAETETLRIATSAVVAARESALERELQLDEGVAELYAQLRDAVGQMDEATARADELSRYACGRELVQMAI